MLRRTARQWRLAHSVGLMILTHLGHSCLLVDVDSIRILIDPGSFSEVEGVRDLTAILVTHTHPDHLNPPAIPALLRDNPKAELWLESEAADRLKGSEPQLGNSIQRMTSGQALTFGSVTVTPIGQKHALIHDRVPHPDNLGLVITSVSAGEDNPTLFHPGDALDADHPLLDELDVLCVPINAPWASVADTLAFVQRLTPKRVVPIHDGLLNDAGRQMYIGHIEKFGATGGIDVVDLKGQGPIHI